MDTILMNRLDGDAPGPVKVLVSSPVYSHDRQHVLIPDGTIVLGEARKIGATGFGQQRRMAVVFHRMIMPDGYSVDLDQFHGLDQIGEEGLKDKVNNHYLQIFGTSIALGVIAGAGEIEAGGGTIIDERFSGVHDWCRLQRLAVGNHRARPVYSDSSHDHHSGGTSRQSLFRAGHALACIRQSHDSANFLRRHMRRATVSASSHLPTSAAFWLPASDTTACDPADSAAVCKGFQKCFASDTSTEVCRMG